MKNVRADDFKSDTLPSGGGNSLVPPKRLSKNATLTLVNNVAPNPNHPLSGLDSEIRTSERIRVISSVLSRLLRDQVSSVVPPESD